MSVPLIGGKHGVVFFGPRSNPKCLRYWAERGLIHCEDARDNSFETLSVRDFLQRVNANSDMVRNSITELATTGYAHYDELERIQRFIEEAAALAEKAREQGMPPRLFSGRLYHQRFGAVVKPKARHMF